MSCHLVATLLIALSPWQWRDLSPWQQRDSSPGYLHYHHTCTAYTIAMGTPSPAFCCYGKESTYHYIPSVAMETPSFVCILLLWKWALSTPCHYGATRLTLLPSSHTVAVDTPTFPTWSCMPPHPIILSVWRADSRPSFACGLLGWWAWLWISRFKMAAGRQEAGMNEATGVRRHYLRMRASVLLTVEPLYRGHHWDPAGCPVYSGTSL